MNLIIICRVITFGIYFSIVLLFIDCTDRNPKMSEDVYRKLGVKNRFAVYFSEYEKYKPLPPKFIYNAFIDDDNESLNYLINSKLSYDQIFYHEHNNGWAERTKSLDLLLHLTGESQEKWELNIKIKEHLSCIYFTSSENVEKHFASLIICDSIIKDINLCNSSHGDELMYINIDKYYSGKAKCSLPEY